MQWQVHTVDAAHTKAHFKLAGRHLVLTGQLASARWALAMCNIVMIVTLGHTLVM